MKVKELKNWFNSITNKSTLDEEVIVVINDGSTKKYSICNLYHAGGGFPTPDNIVVVVEEKEKS